jgi:hypothetical protein
MLSEEEQRFLEEGCSVRVQPYDVRLIEPLQSHLFLRGDLLGLTGKGLPLCLEGKGLKVCAYGVWVVSQGAPLIVRLQKEVIVTIEVGSLDCKYLTFSGRKCLSRGGRRLSVHRACCT